MEASMDWEFLKLAWVIDAQNQVRCIQAKGGGQLALENTNSNVDIRYLGGGVHFLISGGRGDCSFKIKSAEFHGTVDEDPTCSPWGWTKHTDGRPDLVRDACDAGKVRVVGVCQDADLF